MKSPKNLNKHRSLIPDSTRATVDVKLTQAAILLEYAFVHKVDFQERTIRLTGDVDTEMFDLVDSAMTILESQNRKTITVKIDSPGGEVYQALAIVGRLTSSPCHVITEGYGHIMSAATLILASGDKRKVSRFAFFMHHEQSYQVDGRHSEIVNAVKQSEREDKKWAQWMAEFSSKPSDFWEKEGVSKDSYFDPDQLLKLGVVDEIF